MASRTDHTLLAIAVTGSLTLSIAGSSGTEYGQWRHYGVTDPVALGVVSELLFSSAWFLQLFAVLDALLVLVLSVHFARASDGLALRSLGVLMTGVALSHVNLFLVDLSYWWNLYVDVPLYDVPRSSGVAMYVADEVPTVAFLVAFVLNLWRRYGALSTPIAAAAVAAPVPRRRLPVARA